MIINHTKILNQGEFTFDYCKFTIRVLRCIWDATKNLSNSFHCVSQRVGVGFFNNHRKGDQDFLVKIGGSPYRGLSMEGG